MTGAILVEVKVSFTVKGAFYERNYEGYANS